MSLVCRVQLHRAYERRVLHCLLSERCAFLFPITVYKNTTC